MLLSDILFIKIRKMLLFLRNRARISNDSFFLMNQITITYFSMNTKCFYLQLDHDKLVTLVAAGNEIIGEHHIVKWPIAKILILFRPKDLNDSNAKSNLKWDFRNPKNKAEILLRYQHTPAVISSRSMLVYSQPRTRGMCSVLDFWP